MILNITKQAEAYLEALAKKLEISPNRYQEAETSYKSLGEWLHRDESLVKDYDPDVYVQGSFRLGTVVRPASGNEEYDIDCTCVLRALTKTSLSQAQLKDLLGYEIKLYRKSKGMTKDVQEGRRCLTLEYADNAQFHMDVVPAIPNGEDQRKLLEAAGFDVKFASTAIAITDNEVLPQYLDITHDWPRSNPVGYSEWFKYRMGKTLNTQREKVLTEMRSQGITASVEDIPVHRVRTPLQSAIMILKRHRNTTYENDENNIKPISIILSTLSAHAYNGEETIGLALVSILTDMEKAIEHDGNKYIIRNPTDASENFADKWEEYPERAEAFFDWLKKAQLDFSSVANLAEHRQMSNVLAPRMGRELVDHISNTTSSSSSPLSLLGAATAASALSSTSVSFGNAPRNPKKPDGFA